MTRKQGGGKELFCKVRYVKGGCKVRKEKENLVGGLIIADAGPLIAAAARTVNGAPEAYLGASRRERK